jgi:hypothetical protein
MGALSGDIQIVNVDPNTGRVSLRIVPRIITGYQKLIQIVVLSLLNTPGKDILNPTDGGGLLSIVGTNIDSTDSTQILAQLNQAVKKTEREIIGHQTGLSASPEELLKELQVLSLTTGAEIDEVLLTVRIINQAGRVTDVIL